MFGALLLAILPTGDQPMCDRCDLAEVNHVYDQEGKPVLVQVIFYDWLPDKSKHEIRAWRLIKNPYQRPELLKSGEYRTLIHDCNIVRDVRATHFRESWTMYDVEREARQRGDGLGTWWRGLLFEK